MYIRAPEMKANNQNMGTEIPYPISKQQTPQATCTTVLILMLHVYVHEPCLRTRTSGVTMRGGGEGATWPYTSNRRQNQNIGTDTNQVRACDRPEVGLTHQQVQGEINHSSNTNRKKHSRNTDGKKHRAPHSRIFDRSTILETFNQRRGYR